MAVLAPTMSTSGALIEERVAIVEPVWWPRRRPRVLLGWEVLCAWFRCLRLRVNGGHRSIGPVVVASAARTKDEGPKTEADSSFVLRPSSFVRCEHDVTSALGTRGRSL